MSKHALLAASSAHRWMNCTPCAVLEAAEPDTTSESAKEGTLAHAIAELKLRKHYLEPMGPQAFSRRMKKFKDDPLYNEEMQRYTDEYMQTVKEAEFSYSAGRPLISVEKRLDFSAFVPDGFGTGDCILLGGDTLHIIDFKYGKHVVVEPEENPQMMLYALGAILQYNMFYNIRNVHITICQPRAGGTKTWTTTRDKILDWAQFTVKPRAQAAFKGEGELKKGEWCTFCRVRAKCQLQADSLEAVRAFDSKLPPILSNYEVGEALEAGRPFVDWFRKLEEYALSAILRGDSIPGWKAVEGRTSRAFIDTDNAFTAVEALGYDKNLLYERKPITLTAVEKLMGKKDFEAIAETHVQRSPGKPALVPESDPREAYRGINAADYFKPQIEGGNK